MATVLREVALDLDAGADIVMVKPALPCLDIIHRVKERLGVPAAAFAISRAWADLYLTYFALEMAAGR